jgi:soluble lytic murein transglycosylase
VIKRAYPQFLTTGNGGLPDEVLRVVFPLDYWPIIQRYAADRGLDPHFVAALVGQESMFEAAARSVANAYGLLQLVPSTGRRIGRSIGLRRVTVRDLVNPDTNIRLGTKHIADLLAQFREPSLALAAYNAGEARVVEWLRERPGLPQDEFIDDIPFPETRAYVRRILGTTEDYRRLYPLGTATGSHP